jgi:hypothetical protein
VRPTSSRHSSGSALNAHNSSGSGPDAFGGEDESDCIVGHCSIGLEQLCKVALVSSGGASGCISVSRLLTNKGRPMFNMDPRTMQVCYCCCLAVQFCVLDH